MEARQWIVQRCTQQWKGTELLYQDWMVKPMSIASSTLAVVSNYHSEDLMTKTELLEKLTKCHEQWPDDEFRGHNIVNCKCDAHVVLKAGIPR
jgi:hypothetical protein